jgi:Ca2+-binding EF-hand superfamily protein
MDGDGDGAISKQEFLQYCLKYRKKAVKPFDPKDFQALISSKDDKQIRTIVDKIFTSVDTNGSGQWEFEELKSMLIQLSRY